MGGLEWRLRQALADLLGRLPSGAPPTPREERILADLLRARWGDPRQVSELLAFVEEGVDLGSFQPGALGWLAARALALLELLGGVRRVW